jgi:hypothetical protein
VLHPDSAVDQTEIVEPGAHGGLHSTAASGFKVDVAAPGEATITITYTTVTPS